MRVLSVFVIEAAGKGEIVQSRKGEKEEGTPSPSGKLWGEECWRKPEKSGRRPQEQLLNKTGEAHTARHCREVEENETKN